jgi:hypothetical protein
MMKDNLYLLGRAIPTSGVVYLTPKELPNTVIKAISSDRQKQLVAFMRARCVGCGACEGVTGVTQTGTVLTTNNEAVNKGQDCKIATGGNFIVSNEGIELEEIKPLSASNQA